MKKFILVLLLLIFSTTCLAGSNAIMAVIARKNASVSSGSIGATNSTGSATYYQAEGIIHSNYTTITAGAINYVHIKVNDGNAATGCVALFDSADNYLTGKSFSLGDGADGWINTALDAQYNLAAGAHYVGISFTGANPVLYYSNTNGGSIWHDSAAYSCGANIVTGEETLNSAANKLSIRFDNVAGAPE